MNRLIAFTGLAGSGKSTAAEYFTTSHRYHEQSFAKPGKEAIQKLFDIPHSHIFGNKEEKEKVIVNLSRKKPITGRYLMQTFMTEWARDLIDPDLWIYKVSDYWDLMKTVPGFTGVVISDLRFDNEALWVKQQGGVIIKLITEEDQKTVGDGHKSEQGVSQCYIDAEVVNCKNSKPSLWLEIESILQTMTGIDHTYSKYKSPMDLDVMRNIPKVESSFLWPVPPTIPSRREEDKLEDLRSLIVDWADTVFPNRTIKEAIQKMVFEEIPEYLLAQKDPMELADIGILLYDIANLAGIDLEAAIREKMEINKRRSWARNEETGLMSHIKDEDKV